MDIKLRIQQQPLFNFNQQQIYYYGANPQSLNVAVGTLPAPRQWQQYGQFIDVTDYVSDLTAFKIIFTEDRDDAGTVTPGAFQPKITASGNLQFEGLAYQLIKQWLIDDVSASLNAIAVHVEHVGCGTYKDLSIKASDLIFCDDENKTCTFDVILKQRDMALHCIQNTLITDNHQGWFPEGSQIPDNGKKHPRFSYCNEIRPNGQLVMMWYVGAVTWAVTGLFLIVIMMAINAILVGIVYPIIAVINAIIAVVNVFGAGLAPLNYPKLLDPLGVIEDYEIKFIESAGCGREHPAPLIRDYISNVCSKCGVTVDAATAPIFFSTTYSTQTSDKSWRKGENPYYNACYFNAPVKRGIRRVENISPFGNNPVNNYSFWIPENSPFMTGDMFLDHIKGMFNAEWRVKNNTLYFQRKDFWTSAAPVFDFNIGSPDRLKLLEGICFEATELKYYASCKGIYDTDGIDTPGNEARVPMNGYPVVFGKTEENPNFNGILDKTQQFGATKFRLDGHATDYIYDAMQVVLNGAVFTGFLVPAFKFIIAPAIAEFADYALLLESETAVLPKILIWDGQSYTNARAVRTKCWAQNLPLPAPTINQPYNNYPFPTPYNVRYNPQTFVIGSALTLGNSPYGYYKVQDYFGIEITKQPAILMNWPMYFDCGYKDTLWDWFHWIDDPKQNPRQNLSWTATLELCCDTLNDLDVFKDPRTGDRVLLPLKYYPDGVLKEIEIDYNTDELGQRIILRGNC